MPLVSSSGIIDHIDQFKVKAPGVVTGRSGSIGDVFFVEDNFWPLNTSLYVKEYFGNDERFVFLLLQSLELGRFASGTGVPTLNRNHISDEIVFVPDCREEQRRIVAVLDEAFAAIASSTATAEKSLANIEELLVAAVRAVFENPASNWATRPFEACIGKVKCPAKIQRRDFKSQGAFPIVSQEADFINGYWDDPNDLLRVPNPLLVFGDHTQVLKYVDFDFVLGADGVKLLLPQAFLDARFLLYFLKANPVESKGYARHYRHLKSLAVPIPPIVEQKRIAARLDELADAVNTLEATIRAKLELHSELKQSLLQRAFTGELNAATPDLIPA